MKTTFNTFDISHVDFIAARTFNNIQEIQIFYGACQSSMPAQTLSIQHLHVPSRTIGYNRPVLSKAPSKALVSFLLRKSRLGQFHFFQTSVTQHSLHSCHQQSSHITHTAGPSGFSFDQNKQLMKRVQLLHVLQWPKRTLRPHQFLYYKKSSCGPIQREDSCFCAGAFR